MPTTKDYSMREMLLDQCLGTGDEYTREELMELVNSQLVKRKMRPITSRSTFMLDIQEMNNKFRKMYKVKGIVSKKRGRKVYYRYQDGIQSIYNRELTDDELERLHEVRSLLKGLRGMPRFDWLDELDARFDQNMMGGERVIASFESGTTKDTQFFSLLFDAIMHHRVLTIEYQRFGLEAKQRVIHPYFLKQYRLRWYLYATIDQKDSVCCFGLDRIQSVCINKEVEYKESPVDFAHYFDDIVGVTKPDDGQVEHIRLKVDKWLEYYLRTSPIHASQCIEDSQEDGACVTLDVMVNHELEQELLFYAEHLTVVEPFQLREQLVGRIRKQLGEYQ